MAWQGVLQAQKEKNPYFLFLPLPSEPQNSPLKRITTNRTKPRTPMLSIIELKFLELATIFDFSALSI
jgi:hypothetical protein